MRSGTRTGRPDGSLTREDRVGGSRDRVDTREPEGPKSTCCQVTLKIDRLSQFSKVQF